MRLSGKVAIVTGASANIGGALAAGLAAEGARVVCTDLLPAVAEAAAERVRAAGSEAIAVAGDVTDPDHVSEAVDRALDAWGAIDVLVNNAVVFDKQGVLTMPVDRFRRQVDVILTGSFLFTAAVARAMIDRQREGSIVNILSTAAWQGQPGNVGYCTAKSGLANMTRSVAMELAGHGIRVNSLTPTATENEPAAVRDRPAHPPPEFVNDFRQLVPLRRLPAPSDYVPALVYLASDDSRFVTGTNLVVDSGALARYWAWRPEPTT